MECDACAIDVSWHDALFLDADVALFGQHISKAAALFELTSSLDESLAAIDGDHTAVSPGQFERRPTYCASHIQRSASRARRTSRLQDPQAARQFDCPHGAAHRKLRGLFGSTLKRHLQSSWSVMQSHILRKRLILFVDIQSITPILIRLRARPGLDQLKPCMLKE